MKYILLGIGVFLLVFIFQYLAKGKNMSDKSTVKSKIDSGALVVDVRTPSEYAGGHYPKAINIPLDSLRSRLHELGDKNREIVVYCLSGGRSATAKQILESAGFSKVTNGGGIADMPR